MPHLKKGKDGSIIMIGSVAGVRPVGSSVPYSGFGRSELLTGS